MLAPATVPAKNPNQNVKITSLKTSKKKEQNALNSAIRQEKRNKFAD